MASVGLERLAEDGNTADLTTDFEAASGTSRSTVIAGTQLPGPVAPGETASTSLRLDPMGTDNGFLSWASMVIPSNDAFVANSDPMAHPLFDVNGDFVGVDFTVAAASARDAGTEMNDEVPGNTAFFGQMNPNTGVTTATNIIAHPGFLPVGSGGILADPMFVNADFANTAGYEFMRVFLREGAAVSAAAGSATVTLDANQTDAVVNIAVANLSGAVTGMHIHRGAAGSTGPVEVTLTGLIDTNEGGNMTANGTVVLTPTQVADLKAGLLYLNIHTALNPSGEVRGQL